MPDDSLYNPSAEREFLPAGARPLDRNPAAVYLASLAEGSRRTMHHSLNVIAWLLSNDKQDAFALDWSQVRYPHTAAVRAWLAEHYQPTTANKMLAALRQVLRHAWMLGQMSAEDYHRARDVGAVRGATLPAGRDLGSGEIAALMQACERDPSPAGARDAAVIALMYATGIRRASVVALDLSDYDPANQTLRVRAAKGRKDYLAHVPQNGASHALEDWLSVRGYESGPLFWPVNKGGKLTPRRLSSQAIYNLLVKRGIEAGVSHFSPHDLRRTLAGDLLDAGADVVTVQRILAHSNVQTTARYDRRPEASKRKAAALIHVPYRGRGRSSG
ncbi:MAG: tyrosine-type recombinase/integrase [Chloroflexota bacterium]|nr:tyrosine-type recombinase/integrase [Anaerolineae bacterium]HMM29514.1 tyrosine-type recombinase/integrase [Aggregatilineaceae bacterium]